jgi:hypothetical protein
MLEIKEIKKEISSLKESEKHIYLSKFRKNKKEELEDFFKSNETSQDIEDINLVLAIAVQCRDNNRILKGLFSDNLSTIDVAFRGIFYSNLLKE